MGEKFAANPVTGTGSMSIPLPLSSGRGGFTPSLSLSYDSGAGNGPFGFGWNLGIPSLTRKTDKGLPKYQDAVESDVYILSGAEDLVPILENDKPKKISRAQDGYTVYPYRPRIEGLFARIERWVRDSDSDTHWRSITKDNILTLYGKDAESRLADPENPDHIFSWLICETRDDKGNAVLYQYKKEDGAGVNLSRAHEQNRGNADDIRRTANRYLKRVLYSNHKPLLDSNGQRPIFLLPEQLTNTEWLFETVFDYGEHSLNNPTPSETSVWDYRQDAFSTYRSGFEVRTKRLCKRVLIFHHFETEQNVGKNCLVRSTDFNYSHQQDPSDARNPIYTFLESFTQTSYKRQGTGYLKKSLPPVEFEYSQPIVQDEVEEVNADSLENLPIGIDGTLYQWVDLHGEGIPGILSEQGTAWFYKRNTSPIAQGKVELAPLERVATKPKSGWWGTVYGFSRGWSA
jgi:Salmonella virulence plasmid 65kDa B protein